MNEKTKKFIIAFTAIFIFTSKKGIFLTSFIYSLFPKTKNNPINFVQVHKFLANVHIFHLYFLSFISQLPFFNCLKFFDSRQIYENLSKLFLKILCEGSEKKWCTLP
jgi:hypothetical protein